MPTLNEQRNLFATVYEIHHLEDLFKKYFLRPDANWPPVDAKRVTQSKKRRFDFLPTGWAGVFRAGERST
jgi:hypothetical protein